MYSPNVSQLTPEQEKLLLELQQKWIKLATQPIDKVVVTAVIEKIFNRCNEPTPKLIFVSSPIIALSLIEEYFDSSPKSSKSSTNQVDSLFPFNFENHRAKGLYQPEKLEADLVEYLEKCLTDYIKTEIGNIYTFCFDFFQICYNDDSPNTRIIYFPGELCGWVALHEFYKILGDEVACDYESEWDLILDLCQNCGLILGCAEINVLIVCDRPTKVLRDAEGRIHAEGEPAIVFGDGDWAHYVYFHHGVMLPEKYGEIPPKQWQSQWLLAEKNAHLRQVLIAEIGYDRISQELPATFLDSWQEYTLLKIDADIDEEAIHLLKMTCPSTDRINVVRVPPNITSANTAVQWLNREIAPEEFAIQA